MTKEEKCVEYYFDSQKYNESEIIENMQKEEIGFEKKKAEINITYNGSNKIYGNYKTTKTNQPI